MAPWALAALLLATPALALRRARPEGPGRELDELLARRGTVSMREVKAAAGKALGPVVEQVRKRSVAMSREGGRERFWNPCHMAKAGGCPLSNLPRGVSTAVFPGGRTRCIFGDEFAFHVRPGARDRLLLAFEGGGACWDEVTTTVQPACLPQVHPTEMLGPFNPCPGENPFAGHTVIFVSACSGDLHAGNVKRPWPNAAAPEKGVEQHGYDNTRSAVEWAKANLDSRLASFALVGESAGAIAVQLWAHTLLREFSYESASVLADAYAGIFPAGFQGPIFKEMGTCGLFSPELAAKCESGQISIPEVYDAAMKEFPDVRFANLNSKHDFGQILFYNLATTTTRLKKIAEFCGGYDVDACDTANAPPELLEITEPMNGEAYHSQLEPILAQHSKSANYGFYEMSGGAHGLSPVLFGECPGVDYAAVGFVGGAAGAQRLGVRSWMTNLVQPSGPVQRICEKLDSLDTDDSCSPALEAVAAQR